MTESRLVDLIPILQTAIGPVILISGVGLLLLTMTNRLARVIDRTRLLVTRAHDLPATDSALLDRQMSILRRRARLVRAAILFASLSVLFVSVLIALLFLAALLSLEITGLLIAVFIAALAALVVSLIAFIRDVNLSLVALDMEVERMPGR